MATRARTVALALSLVAACAAGAGASHHHLGVPESCGPPGVAGGWERLARGEADPLLRHILVHWMAE